ncbi:hypothetical protein QQS21_010854 [Conoideocrella luteorostrata]|uniref:Uncharacterized protein n=1 Tax=Conoideocrella luteorostrata TaxID=1105319 RepID=A0AAJ0CEH5_9HYPO|nr:hypothetical protein QQS21_010854 [Conoideocrella luteorostrata]
MLKLTASYGALALLLIADVQSIPVTTSSASEISTVQSRGSGDWQNTLSKDTLHRLDVARQHLYDESAPGQAFRNDTIMRVNIEREALELSLIDLSQAFGMILPASRASITGGCVHKRGSAEDFREEAYLRSGTMTYPSVAKRGTAEDFREEAYLRSGTMTYPSVAKRGDDGYSRLLDRSNLALGAIERINIAHRVLHQQEITMEQAKETGSHSDEYVSAYWQSSMEHGGFWTSDQAAGKPNFIEGGQGNGFGFTQSTFHKLHCLANLRMMLAWHINGSGDKMTRDMNVHVIHCLEYIRGRELQNSDLNEEPIDTVDYKGMGIH